MGRARFDAQGVASAPAAVVDRENPCASAGPDEWSPRGPRTLDKTRPTGRPPPNSAPGPRVSRLRGRFGLLQAPIGAGFASSARRIARHGISWGGALPTRGDSPHRPGKSWSRRPDSREIEGRAPAAWPGHHGRITVHQPYLALSAGPGATSGGGHRLVPKWREVGEFPVAAHGIPC